MFAIKTQEYAYVGMGLFDRFGDTLRFAALTIIATYLYGEASMLAAISAARFLPWLLAGPWGGALADAVGNYRLARAANILKGVATGWLACAIIVRADALLVVVLAFVCSFFGVILDAAHSSWVPKLVEGDRLPTVNATLISWQNITGLIAPAVAGFIAIAWDSIYLGIALMVSIIGAQVTLYLLRGHRDNQPPTPITGQVVSQAWQDGWRGMLATMRHSRLWPLCITVQLMNTVGGFQLVAIPFYLNHAGLADSRQLGFTLSAGAIGMVLGNVLGQRALTGAESPRLIVGLLGSMAAQLALFIGISQSVTSSLWITGMLLCLVGVFSGVWNVVSMTLVMWITPKESLGITISSYKTLALIAAPLGSVLAGVIIGVGRSAQMTYGFPITLAACAVTVLAVNHHRWADKNTAQPTS